MNISIKNLLTLNFALLSGYTFAQEKPNIIVFLVDDMGLMDTSVPFIVDSNGKPQQQPLNNWYNTPNMERLANQGIRFSTFYAQSVSSPSRTSIMTGQNSARHHTTNWIDSNFNNRDTFGPYDWNWKGLNSSVCTYPRLLQQAGYRTIHVGKAHFGCNESEGKDPLNLGFDINIGGSGIGHPGSYYGEYGYGLIKGQRSHAVPDLEKYHGSDTFLTEALTIEACNEIKKCVSQGIPFYLNMAHYAVHAPFQADKRFLDNYPSGEKSDEARAFATLVEGMDKSLGDIMNQLIELGIADNTLIIFLGDNGGDAPLGGADEYGSSAPLRGKKGSEYEGGVRVPFIAAWGQCNKDNKFQKEFPIAENMVQTQMATVMDIYPTILEVAGVKSKKNHILDGASLLKMFNGEKDKKHRDDFLMHFPHNHRGSYFTTYRKGDWKLIYYYNPDRDGIPSYKLYNLKDDPFESTDLSSSKPDVLKKLSKEMISRLKLEKAQYPIDGNGKTLYPIEL